VSGGRVRSHNMGTIGFRARGARRAQNAKMQRLCGAAVLSGNKHGHPCLAQAPIAARTSGANRAMTSACCCWYVLVGGTIVNSTTRM
jgi:hypothetical protein